MLAGARLYGKITLQVWRASALSSVTGSILQTNLRTPVSCGIGRSALSDFWRRSKAGSPKPRIHSIAGGINPQDIAPRSW